MRKSVGLAGLVAASAGVLAGGAPAFADSADNDGLNIGNDNKLSVLPIQLCGNNISVVGAVVSLVSPQLNSCVNAPIVDHPKPPVYEQKPPVWNPPRVWNPPVVVDPPVDPPAVSDPGRTLPAAPAPVAVRGHHAVTG